MSRDKIYSHLDRMCGLAEFDAYDIIGKISHARLAAAKQRPTSPGQLRGGSVGAIINNEVYGICHRKAYLRFKGIETPLPQNVELMTDQGETNEDIWESDLKLAYEGTGIKVKNQNEFDCTWDINGTPASGSPDIVLWDGKKPVMGLELKNLSKDSTAIGAHFEMRPKTDHLIQAANYSLRMGDKYLGGEPLPYKLVYSSRSIWTLPKDNPDGKPDKRRTIVLAKGWDVNWLFGRPNSIMPFHREFLLHWDIDGRLRYWTAGYKAWVKTDLTRKSIDDYYAAVSAGIDEKNFLGPRPTDKHLDGKRAYSPCGFCDFNRVCEIGNSMTPLEFQDRAKLHADEMWKARENGIEG